LVFESVGGWRSLNTSWVAFPCGFDFWQGWAILVFAFVKTGGHWHAAARALCITPELPVIRKESSVERGCDLLFTLNIFT